MNKFQSSLSEAVDSNGGKQIECMESLVDEVNKIEDGESPSSAKLQMTDSPKKSE